MRRSSLLIESHRELRRLYIFDFDGTLAITPGPTKGNISIYRRFAGQISNTGIVKKWWDDPDTLSAQFEIKPVRTTIKSYRRAQLDKNGLVIIMTGRADFPGMRTAIIRILSSFDIENPILFLRPPERETLNWKSIMLCKLIAANPKIEQVLMWDDVEEYLVDYGRILDELHLRKTLIHVRCPDWIWNSSIADH